MGIRFYFFLVQGKAPGYRFVAVGTESPEKRERERARREREVAA